jgi:hypothetical protein
MPQPRLTYVGTALAKAISDLTALRTWPVAERPLHHDEPNDLRDLENLARAVAHCVDPVIKAISEVASLKGHDSVLWDALDGELSFLLHERAVKLEDEYRAQAAE